MSNIKTSKYKYKSIILFIILVSTIILVSCEDITSITSDDWGNILSVIIKDDDTSTTEARQANPVSANTENPDFVDSTENDLAGVIDTAETNTPVNVADTPENNEPAVTTERTASNTSDNTNRVLSDAVKYFPDMPDTFKYVPYPDTVSMNDSLKKAINNLDSLLKKNFGGSDFYVATSNPELITPMLGGGNLSDARHYRTRLVETAYNINVQSIFYNRNDIYTTISNSVKAGDYISDIVCAPLDVQSLFIQTGILINLRKMPFMNLNAGHYNKSSVLANTLNGEIYGCTSDFLFDPSKIYAVFYNKNLLKNCGLENLDDLYDNENWTYDYMLELCKILATNVDTAANDLFSIGLSIENNDVLNGTYLPAGFSSPFSVAYADIEWKLGDVFARITTNRDSISPLISNDDTAQRNAFSQGSVLFAIMTLDVIPEITDSAFDWGVLPIPAIKVNDSHIYPSLAFTKNSALFISILKGARNTEKCGIITEAFSIASHEYMREMYVSDLMTYNLRDMTSVNMLDKIVNNVKYKNMGR